MPRNLAILDVQQLFLSARQQYGMAARTDYVKLRDKVLRLSNGTIVDFLAYAIVSPFHNDNRFVSLLKKHGILVFRKMAVLQRPVAAPHTDAPLDDVLRSVQFENWSWTKPMVAETIKILSSYSHVFIASGNGLFCQVVDACHVNGKNVTVLSFQGSLHEQLSEKADRTIVLDQAYLFDSSAHSQGHE